MPNTLAHLGVQTLVTRGAVGVDIRWVAIGCLVPDLPWILRRLLAPLPIDPYDLRLYAIVQASLFFCFFFCAAAAVFSSRPLLVFCVLAGNSTAHLVLDALQTKWGNGVHLAAPWTWRMTSFELFWPEDTLTGLLTVGGLGFFVFLLTREPAGFPALRQPQSRAAGLLAAGALVLWLAGPLLFLDGPAVRDNHSLATLRSAESRPGRPVAVDRGRLLAGDGGHWRLRIFSGEEIPVESWSVAAAERRRPGRVSIQGRFNATGALHVSQLHVHAPGLRDAASILGLALLGIVAARDVRHRRAA